MSATTAIHESVLQDGSRVTHYIRAGHGPPLLVLWDHDDGAFLECVSVLATAFRVIAPRLPPGAGNAGQLASFVEGAGLVGIHVVANAAFADQVMALAGRNGWGEVIRCATVIATAEDFAMAVKLLIRYRGCG